MQGSTQHWLKIAEPEYGLFSDDTNDSNGGTQCDCLPPYFFVVTDSEWACELHMLYGKAISRHSTYMCDLFSHIISGSGTVYCPEPYDSALVGQFHGDTFFVSHYCPKGLKSGVQLLRTVLQSKIRFVFCVPDFLAGQLVRSGFHDTGQTIDQWFNDNLITKHVITNKFSPEERVSTVKTKERRKL